MRFPPRTFIIVVFMFIALLASTFGYAANLRVTWEDTSNNEDGFKIERLVAGLVDATITVGPNTNSYTDNNLSTGTVYCYRVMAFNAAGSSAPSNQPCAMAQNMSLAAASLTVSPTSVTSGGTISTSWSGINNSTATDWIGVYAPNSDDMSFIDWFYLSCSKNAGAARTAGSCAYALSQTLAAGSYELRLYANDGFVRLGTSNAFGITSGSNNSPIPGPTVSVSPTTAAPGGTVTVSWNGINATSPTDWVGLYAPVSEDTGFIDWFYVSCAKTPGSARSTGSCSYALPGALASGTHELRLYANDGYSRLATANALTVTTLVSTPVVSDVPTITANPATIAPKGAMTVSWNGIAAATTTDWIGLYVPGAADMNFMDWIYVSCSRTPGAARSSGSCSHTLPAMAGPGNYELRLYADDGYTRLATSNTLSVSAATTTVLASAASTEVVLLTSSNSATTTTGVSTVVVPEWSAWTDYRATLQLQSSDRNSIGIMFRYQDDDNYYRFVWNRQPRSRRLEKVANGAVSVLARDSVPYVAGRTYQVELIVEGPSLKILIDGTQVFSVTDESFNGGTIALYSDVNQGSRFDNILVDDLVTGAVLLSNDFTDRTISGWTIIDRVARDPSSWSAESGSLVQSSKASGTYALYTARQWSDYRLSAKLKSMNSGAMGLMFRYVDDRNHYRFVWTDRSRSLEKIENGAMTVLAQDSQAYAVGQEYKADIIADGLRLELRVDGATIFSVNDSQFSHGGVGLLSQNNRTATFDEVAVQDLMTGAVVMADDFSDGSFGGWTIVGGSSTWSAQSGALVGGTVNGASFALFTY